MYCWSHDICGGCYLIGYMMSTKYSPSGWREPTRTGDAVCTIASTLCIASSNAPSCSKFKSVTLTSAQGKIYFSDVFNDSNFEFIAVTPKILLQVSPFVCRANGPPYRVTVLKEVPDDPRGYGSICTRNKNFAWGLNGRHDLNPNWLALYECKPDVG